MAKKKITGKKKKGAKSSDAGDADGMGLPLQEQQIKYLTTQTTALEAQLAKRSMSTTEAKIQLDEMKKMLNETSERYEEGKQLTSALTRDMTRQYKGMQDDLLHKINARERTIAELQDTLEKNVQESTRMLQTKDNALQLKEEKIHEMEQKMDEMAIYFATMLSKALELMKDRIAAHSASYNEHAVPIQNRMEEYNFDTIDDFTSSTSCSNLELHSTHDICQADSNDIN